MMSQRPKPLHALAGRPMVAHVLYALADLQLDRVIVVVGHGSDQVTKVIGEHQPPSLKVEFVDQKVQRGTGDAVLVALGVFTDDYLDDADDVIVAPGDTPLLRPETLSQLVGTHRDSGAAATVLTARVADPSGYGRIVRDRTGRIARIVEHRDATDGERAIDEINTSIYVFRRSVLAPAIRRLSPDNSQGELYLTDVVAVIHNAGYPVSSFEVPDSSEAAGVNDRCQLANAEAELRRRINERWMRLGVTMLDPGATYIDSTVKLAGDIVLYPGTILEGATVIESGAVIGPATRLVDCRIGSRAQVEASVGRDAEVAPGTKVGPWARLGAG